jgi:hypothetical protein
MSRLNAIAVQFAHLEAGTPTVREVDFQHL